MAKVIPNSPSCHTVSTIDAVVPWCVALHIYKTEP
jgi:hypothetical protein